jgi:hypothetical protein
VGLGAVGEVMNKEITTKQQPPTTNQQPTTNKQPLTTNK